MKPIPQFVAASGYACGFPHAGAVPSFPLGNIVSAAWRNIVHSLKTSAAHMAVKAEETDNFPGVELAAGQLGICPMKLQDVVSGWLENATLLGIWNKWLEAHPRFRPAYDASGLVHGACKDPFLTTNEAPSDRAEHFRQIALELHASRPELARLATRAASKIEEANEAEQAFYGALNA